MTEGQPTAPAAAPPEEDSIAAAMLAAQAEETAQAPAAEVAEVGAARPANDPRNHGDVEQPDVKPAPAASSPAQVGGADAAVDVQVTPQATVDQTPQVTDQPAEVGRAANDPRNRAKAAEGEASRPRPVTTQLEAPAAKAEAPAGDAVPAVTDPAPAEAESDAPRASNDPREARRLAAVESAD